MSHTTAQQPLTVAELAARDQHDAREREFDRRAQKCAAVFLTAVLALTGYTLFGIAGDVPLPPWSPIGQAQSDTDAPLDPAPVVIPPGYAPAVPGNPQVPSPQGPGDTGEATYSI